MKQNRDDHGSEEVRAGDQALVREVLLVQEERQGGADTIEQRIQQGRCSTDMARQDEKEEGRR